MSYRPLLPHEFCLETAATVHPSRRSSCIRGRNHWIAHASALLFSFLFLVGFGTLYAQDTDSSNPTGPSGNFNGDVTTAGCYDPCTGNAKRVVTDLVVPGSNGQYPLVFTRTYNSHYFQVGNDTRYFGDGANWRHSYQWALSSNSNTYTVAYPDGSVTTFRPNRACAPSGESSTGYWRGPAGTSDRLEVQDAAHIYLHTSDGGMVNFGGSAYPSSIVDSNGATTILSYKPNNPAYLDKVYEPGGRWILFNYTTINSSVLLHQITASNGQTVTYTCLQQSGGASFPYYSLIDVSYDQETKTAGGGNVHATYTYPTDSSASAIPLLATAVDPHYAGAMVNISYLYSDTVGTILQERNLNTSEPVSKYDSSSRAETRGDTASGGVGIGRSFTYGYASNALGQTNAAASMLTSVGDFQKNTVYKSYYGVADKDTMGDGYVKASMDTGGNITTYQREPLTGKVTSVSLPDGRTRSFLWRGLDGVDTAHPYYLFQTTDERGQNVKYKRFSNTGLVYEIDYPDGGTEGFQYQGFVCNGYGFYKVSCHTDQRGAQLISNFDGKINGQSDGINHGGSGYLGLLTSVTRIYKDGNQTSHSETTELYYDSYDRLVKSTDQRAITTSYGYNTRHQLTSMTHAADNTSVVYAYDDYGNRTKVTDELNHTTTTAYDEYRRVTSVTVPVNDGVNASRFTAFAYDRRDTNNTSIGTATCQTGSDWSLQWVPSGKATQRIFSPNGWLTDEYDGMAVTGGPNGTEVPSSGPGAVHLSSTFYPVGTVKTRTDAQGYTTQYTYDTCNRPVTVTDPIGHVTSWIYYGIGEHGSNNSNVVCTGWLKSLTKPGPDAGNAVTVTTQYSSYDVMGHLKETIDPYNHAFDSVYNFAGDLTSQTDGAQAQGLHVTGYGYDQLGRKTSLTYPDNTTEKWAYDGSGNIVTYTNRAGAICTYNYTDGRNRCNSRSWSQGVASTNGTALAVSYIYDNASRLTEVANNAADLKYTYDDSGLTMSEFERPGSLSSGLTTQYTHDQDGNITSITYPSTNQPSFAYDNQQRCTGMYGGSTALGLYTYEGNWPRSRWLYPGIYTQYDHQENGRVTDVWNYYGNSTGSSNYGNISLHTYGYAPAGQVSWAARESVNPYSGLDNGRGDAYYYYSDGSLQTVCRNVAVNGGWPDEYSQSADSSVNPQNLIFTGGNAETYSNSYAYDAAGNRTYAAQMNQTPISYADNSSHPGENEYSGSSYDNDGNTTNSAVGWTYTYDAEDHLVSATGPGSQVMTFTYDPLGRVIQQVANGVGTYFYYAGGQRIEERDLSNNEHFVYFFEAPGSDCLLYRQDLTTNAVSSILWYLTDAMGNTTHLCDNSGEVVEQYTYDAYGTPSVYDPTGHLLNVSSKDNRYLFKSNGAYEWLASAGLYYCRARFYLPEHGRFLQPDPARQSADTNLYRYCHNDPVNGSDPAGLDDPDADAPVVPEQNVGSDPVTVVGPDTPTGSHIPEVAYTNSDGAVYSGDAINGFNFFGYISYGDGTSNAPADPHEATLNGGDKGAVALFWGAGGHPDDPNNSNNAITLMTNSAQQDGLSASKYGRDQESSAVSTLENASNQGAPTLSIVGYSRGAVAAIDVANTLGGDGYAVDNLITISPVSYFGNSYSVPSNVVHAYNFYDTNGGLFYGLFHNGAFGGQPVLGAQNWNLTGLTGLPGNPIGTVHTSIPFDVAGSVQAILQGP